jgi:hypothetical protein
MIVQQATLHITFRAVCNVLQCSERMWSPDVYILVTFIGVWNATLFTFRIHCLQFHVLGYCYPVIWLNCMHRL